MKSKKSKLAIFGLVLGIISFLQLLGLEKAVLAIIVSSIALKEMSADNELSGKTFAYTGVILGTVYILVLAILTVVKGPDLLYLISNIKK